MAPLAFDKYEGLGNDFALVEAKSADDVALATAVAMCDRRRGVGADGVLVLLPARDASAVARMRVINSDGSIAEMCGNGLRCVALHLARTRIGDTRAIAVETDAGVRGCTLVRDGHRAVVDCDMGIVRVLGDVTVAGRTFTRADAGNPHAVVFEDIGADAFAELGPRVASDPVFPNGTNVELARVVEGGRIDVLVWERGAGATLACGTGACAVAAVACAQGKARAGERVTVRLPGGELAIAIEPETGRASMRGPARHVFGGSWMGPS